MNTRKVLFVEKKGVKAILVTSAVLSAFLILGRGRLEGWVDRLGMPLREGLWKITGGKSGEIDDLREEVGRLAVNLAEKGRLQEENEALRKQLGVAGFSGKDKIMANVVGGGSGVVRLDLGEKGGVRKGMVVVVGDVVVGRVTSTSDWGSNVSLPTSSSFRMVAWVRGGVSGLRRADGVMTGKGGKAVLTKILKTDQLAEGDLLLSAGEGGDRGNLLIGRISRIETEEEGVYSQATVEPAVDYRSLGVVFVVK